MASFSFGTPFSINFNGPTESHAAKPICKLQILLYKISRSVKINKTENIFTFTVNNIAAIYCTGFSRKISHSNL